MFFFLGIYLQEWTLALLMQPKDKRGPKRIFLLLLISLQRFFGECNRGSFIVTVKETKKLTLGSDETRFIQEKWRQQNCHNV